MKKVLLCCLFFSTLVVPSLGLASHIPVITPSISGPTSGLFTYEYTLENLGPDGIYEFLLVALGPVEFRSIQSPVGWFSIPGGTCGECHVGIFDTVLEWVSSGRPSTDIAFGTSLSGFAFQTSAPPGTIIRRTSGEEPVLGGRKDVLIGSTLGPVSVPEPSAILIIAIGSVLILVRSRRIGA
jgi:hypothetical protein